MGNLHSQSEEVMCGPLASPEERVLSTCDFEAWKNSQAERFGFSAPCVEFHTLENAPYSAHKCHTIEVTGTRRRQVQFRHELACYSAELEKTTTGSSILHIRQHITGIITPLTLESGPGSDQLVELDYLIEPVVTVLAYHCHRVVVSVKEKTKNIPKLVLFCDVAEKRLIGSFSISVNYNNLSGVSVACSTSMDGSSFVLFVTEDHYDEFMLSIYALQLVDGKPLVRSRLQSGHSSWYEPNLHMAYLGPSNDLLVSLGDYPLGLAYSDPCRYLLTYNLAADQLAHCVPLTDSLYPVALSCSSDSSWVGTLSRNPDAWEGDAEGYVVRLYTAEQLALIMEIKVPLAVDNFNALSHCTKVMFSHNNTLLAVTSSDTRPDFGPDFYGYCGGMNKKGTKDVQVTVYRLPVLHLCLKALCRDVILANCQYDHLASLPLPMALHSYLSYVSKEPNS